MRVASLCVLVLSVGGCVLEPPVVEAKAAPERSTDTPQETPPAPAELDPVLRAKQLLRADECVAEARAAHASAPAWAWALLSACVERGHFTALRELLDGTWDRELRQRADAPALLARIVAMRGANVDDDLAVLHSRRVPLFSLADAAARPELFRGQLVLVRAEVQPQPDSPGSTDATSALLIERALASEVRDVDTQPVAVMTREGTSSAPQSASLASPMANYEERATTRQSLRTRRAFNYEVDTGREAIVRMARPDPFLDAHTTWLVLARFDGLVPARNGETPTLTLLTYERPSQTVTY